MTLLKHLNLLLKYFTLVNVEHVQYQYFSAMAQPSGDDLDIPLTFCISNKVHKTAIAT